MSELRRLSGLIGKIYAAGENEARWIDAMDAACAYFEVGSAMHYQIPSLLNEPVLVADRDVPRLDDYFEAVQYYGDPRVNWVLMEKNGPVWHDGAVFAGSRPQDNPYNRWLYSIIPNCSPFGVSLANPEGGWNVVSIIPWGDTLRPTQAKDVEALELLTPHLEAAFRLNRRLGLANAAWDTLDDLHTGVLILDDHGRVLAANAAAEGMSRVKDGLAFSSAGVRCEEFASQTRLDHAFGEALHCATGRRLTAPPPVRISRPSGRRPYALAFSPIVEPNAPPSAAGAVLRAIIADLDAEEALDPAALATLFGLTEAEAHVAAQFAENASIDRTAAALSVSRETVRTHMKALFAKFGVKGQAELMRALSDLKDAAGDRR